MKPFLLIFSFLALSLTSFAQVKKPATKPVAATDTKKAALLFSQFFCMNQGDTADFKKMTSLVVQICQEAPKSKYCSYTAAWASIVSKNYTAAHDAIEGLLRDNPDWAEAYFLNGLYLDETKDNAYVQQVQRCIELAPTLFQPIFFLASKLEESGNFKLSLQYYNKLEQVNPKHKSLYYNRGHVKSKLNDNEGAIADYTKIITADPSHHRALFNRAHMYMVTKEYAKAEIDLTGYLKMQPNYALAYYYRGFAKYSLDRLPEACVDMKIAVELGSKAAEAFLPYCK